MRDSKIFEKAVTKFFEPIAEKLGLPLTKVREGVYDMSSSYFIMRIRLDTGHARGLNVILRPATLRNYDENDSNAPQYGIRAFMQFHGENVQDTLIDVDSDADFLKKTQLLAEAVERYAVPYLLGQGKDLDAIRDMIKAKNEKDLKRIKSYRFPKNVREEWL